MLVQWSTKVNALMLYMATLEDKIKEEQDAREVLTNTYDNSLNTGYDKLNSETYTLSKNPLIKEVISSHVPEAGIDEELSTDLEVEIQTRVVRQTDIVNTIKADDSVTSPAFQENDSINRE